MSFPYLTLWLQPLQEQVSQENYVASGVLVDCRIILLVLFVICVSLQIQSEKCEGNTAGLLVLTKV